MSEVDTLSSILESFSERIAQLTKHTERVTTDVPGLFLFNRKNTTPPIAVVYEPSVCLIAQGEKLVIQGKDRFPYHARSYLLTSVHMPTLACVTEASPFKPCLGVRLQIDVNIVSHLIADSGLPAPQQEDSERCMTTGKVTLPLLEAFHRLLDLVTNKEDIPILSPIIQKEIFYRLLTGERGMQLRRITHSGSRNHQVSKAIQRMHLNFCDNLKVSELAREQGMSPSTFHHHFRAATGVSPHQFLKQIRLQEARRLMLAESQDAATAAFHVGYESPSQFSREYSRHFGSAPVRDITRLREQGLSA